MGDPGGIGPEILLKALRKQKTAMRYLVVGSSQALNLLKMKQGLSLPFHFIVSPAELKKVSGRFLFWDIDLQAPGKIQIGKTSKVNGAKALESLRIAEQLARKGEVQAIVTAPLNKTSVRLVDSKFIGHTEFLARQSGIKKYAMLFVGMIIAAQNETSLKLAVCLDRNTAAFEDCTIELRRIRENA